MTACGVFGSLTASLLHACWRNTQLLLAHEMKRHTYELNTAYDAWMSTDDGHQLLELLMRQLTSRCNGYPLF